MSATSGARFDQAAAANILARAERQIALLERCAPQNAASERARLVLAWQGGGASAHLASDFSRLPRWTLPNAPSFGEVRRSLEALRNTVGEGVVEALVRGRAEELLLEAALVDSRGTPNFRLLARERYPVAPAVLADATALARRWLSDTGPHDLEPGHAPPTGLRHALEARLTELGLSIAVVERAGLAAAAAVGEAALFVRADRTHDDRQIPRIVLHEIEGHVLPRHRARSEKCPLLRVGCRGAGEDEEGRALLLEMRAGHLDLSSPEGRARCRELSLRHLAALAVRNGAEPPEVMELLLGYGLSVEPSVRLAERVFRGGGLAREVAYLPAFLRVSEAFRDSPPLEHWFERGRVSVDAARSLSSAD